MSNCSECKGRGVVTRWYVTKHSHSDSGVDVQIIETKCPKCQVTEADIKRATPKGLEVKGTYTSKRED